MKKTHRNCGVGFMQFLTILFIVLKLTGVIDWSWWWVLSPIWVSVSLAFLLVFLAVVFTGLAHAMTACNRRK